MPAIDAAQGLFAEALHSPTRSGREDYYDGMVPNLGFNIAMLAIWGVLLTIHVLLLYLKQWWFSTAFICTGILEVLGYVGRTWSHFNTGSVEAFLMNMVCLTIAPVFTMGGLYYQLSKLIEIYGHRFALMRPSILYAVIFICCDIISLAIQASGGGVAGYESYLRESVHTGTRVFLAGLAFQVATLSIFIIMMCHFLFKVYVQPRWQHLGAIKFSFSIFKISQGEIDHFYRQKYHVLRMEPDRWVFHYFILGLIVAVLTVFVRCCYRLAEMNSGWAGSLTIHENYFIVLDGVMMALAATTMVIFHPGFAFKGRSVSVRITSGSKNRQETPDIPQPESEQEEDAATVTEDENESEKFENRDDSSPKGIKRNFSMPSLGGSTFVSRMTTFKRPFSRSQRRSQPHSETDHSSGEIPYETELQEVPTALEYPDIPDPPESITPEVV